MSPERLWMHLYSVLCDI